MKLLLLIPVIALTLTQKKCGKRHAAGLPACIQAKIDSIRTQPKWNPPATVEEYRYKGKRVFLFSSPCCDRYNEVFDENCNYLCSPTGGYTGKGDRQCEDFKTQAELIGTVWKDER